VLVRRCVWCTIWYSNASICLCTI